MQLEDYLSGFDNLAIAYSGGIDSTYLLYESLKNCKKVHAFLVECDFVPQSIIANALKIASEIKADVTLVKLDVLANEDIRKNDDLRCYHCKKMIMQSIIEKAKELGFTTVCDGTNASDDYDNRPGMKALAELGVLSPLRICNLTKADIRTNARKAKLSNADLPSFSCLATKVSGELSQDKLAKVKLDTCFKALV